MVSQNLGLVFGSVCLGGASRRQAECKKRRLQVGGVFLAARNKEVAGQEYLKSVNSQVREIAMRQD